MGQQLASEAIRLHDYLDIYVIQPGKKLVHYFTNPETDWRYGKQELANDAVTKPAVIREGGAIDAYYVNVKQELIHYCTGEWNEWTGFWECLDRNVAAENPACVRFGNCIDVFYWRTSGELVHRHVAQNTGWQYSEPNIIAWGGGTNLCALRATESAYDIYFQRNGQLHHINNGDYLGWQHAPAVTYEGLPPIKPGSPIRTTRVDDWIDVFYLTNDDRICQVQCNPDTGMQHAFAQFVAGPGSDKNELAVVGMGANIDVYYLRNNQLFHSHSGNFNGWTWDWPQPISESDAIYGLSAVRTKQESIDVYYVNNTHTLRNLHTGEGTNFDWCQYVYGSSEFFEAGQFGNYTSHRKIMDWNQFNTNYACTFLAKGWNGEAYQTTINGIQFVIKKYLRPTAKAIQEEMNVLEKLNSIHPGILFCELTFKGNLVGFVMKKFKGVTVDSLIKSKRLTCSEKSKIIISFAAAVRKIQKLGICHSDLHTQNLLVSDNHHVEIIDYGNSIVFDSSTRTGHTLTGTDFLRPPQYFKGLYCPVGVNGFQFARMALNIWTGVTYEGLWAQKDSNGQIEQIQKSSKQARFMKPIIELLKIKDPFQRIVNSNLIEELMQESNRQLQIYAPPILNHGFHPVSVPSRKAKMVSRRTAITESSGTIVQSTSSNSIKADYFLKLIPDLAHLAHNMGFAWCGRYNIGEGFYLSSSDGGFTFTTKPQDVVKYTTYNTTRMGFRNYIDAQMPYGYRNHDRLKITFSDIKRNAIPSSNPKERQKIINQEYTNIQQAILQFDNSGGTTDIQMPQVIKRTVEHQVNIAQSSTTSSKTGIKINSEFQTPLHFLGGMKIKVEFSQEVGYSIIKSQTRVQSTKKQLSQQFKTKVKAGKKFFMNVWIIGLKSQVELTFKTYDKFSVTFEGFMRAQDDHGSFHRDGRIRETVKFKFGSENQSFWEQLKNESENEAISEWRWNEICNAHHSTRNIINKLCDAQRYKETVKLKIEGVVGTKIKGNASDH